MGTGAQATAIRLIVGHVAGSEGARFVVTRASDSRQADPVAVPSPVDWKVGGEAGDDGVERGLMAELPWYFERFLDYPFPPRTKQAERIRRALRDWGRKAFEALFDSGRGRDFYRDATRNGPKDLSLEIRSDDPRVLAWPWEALEDPESTQLALGCRIERRVNKISDPPPLSDSLPRDRVNILLVISRPYDQDVAYRSISRPLVEAVVDKKLAVEVTVLRPPTFARLQAVLGENPGHFHILHFDGHGGYGPLPTGSSGGGQAPGPYTYRAPVGQLVFETDDGKPDPVDSEKLSALLKEHQLPSIVLNACRSGMVGQADEDPFASVAAALLKGGVRSVVAMAYELYVSGAKQFLPAFYGRFFETGDIGEAARAGRKKMFEVPGRVCAVGTHDLSDWLVPVVYQQDQLDFTFVGAASKGGPKEGEQSTESLPEAARDDRNPFGFIGRDSALLALERAMRRQPAGILIQGLGGIGKTTLARGFLKWLSETGGLGNGAFWTTFTEVHSAEAVVNQLVEPLLGTNALADPLNKKVQAVASALREHAFVVVWDNFESARGIEGSGIPGLLSREDLATLKLLLETLRGGKTKVIITGRSDEDWLGPTNRYKLPLGGLQGEERWDLCRRILNDLGQSPDEQNEELAELMDALGGHPLLMRATLPRLESKTAGAILAAVQGNLAALGAGSGDELHDKVMATLRFVEESLPQDVRPLLTPLGLHERFVDVDDLEAMGQEVPDKWGRDAIDRFVDALVMAGLLTARGNGIYELHPALTGYLRAQRPSSLSNEPWERAFVDRLARLADHYGPMELHEQRLIFSLHEENFRRARSLAKRLALDAHFAALTQALAAFAQHTGSFGEAIQLYTELANHSELQGADKFAAAAFHQLGGVMLDLRSFDASERWYLKALAIWKTEGDEQGVASTYHQLGVLCFERRLFERSEAWFCEAIKINERRRDELAASNNYHELGRLAEERRDFETAGNWHTKCLAIREKCGDQRGVAMSCHHLGTVEKNNRKFDLARAWYAKSLAIKEAQGDERGAAITYQQLGTTALAENDPLEAEKWFIRSATIKERHHDTVGAARTYYHLGELARLKGDLDVADAWYLKCLGSIRDDVGLSAAAYHGLAVTAVWRGQFEAAAKCFVQSAASFARSGDLPNLNGVANSFVKMLDMVSDQVTRTGLMDVWARSGLSALTAFDGLS